MQHRDQLQVFVFYFDLIGTVAMFQKDWHEALERLEGFQHAVRERAELHVPTSNITTIADNVIARVHPHEIDAVPELARLAIQAADEHGFEKFFGAVTFGLYEPDMRDAAIWSGGDATDVRKQHIGFSEPYLRAAVAEKWSARFAKDGLPQPSRCIWVSEEVFDRIALGAWAPLRNQGKFNLKNLPLNGKPWPFVQSCFTALR